jgi:hypothetical protein
MLTVTDNLLPASMVGHLVANEGMASSTLVASSKLGGKSGGIGPAALGACGLGVGGRMIGFHPIGEGSIPSARSIEEMQPVVPGMFYTLGRPVSWCAPEIFGSRAGARSRLQNASAELDTRATRQDRRQHQDREERF